jgi:hypothetical protein
MNLYFEKVELYERIGTIGEKFPFCLTCLVELRYEYPTKDIIYWLSDTLGKRGNRWEHNYYLDYFYFIDQQAMALFLLKWEGYKIDENLLNFPKQY